MIETNSYRGDRMKFVGFKKHSSEFLDDICDLLNPMLLENNYFIDVSVGAAEDGFNLIIDIKEQDGEKKQMIEFLGKLFDKIGISSYSIEQYFQTLNDPFHNVLDYSYVKEILFSLYSSDEKILEHVFLDIMDETDISIFLIFFETLAVADLKFLSMDNDKNIIPILSIKTVFQDRELSLYEVESVKSNLLIKTYLLEIDEEIKILVSGVDYNKLSKSLTIDTIFDLEWSKIEIVDKGLLIIR